jgi:hypothetical protein
VRPHLAPGTKKDTASCPVFFENLKQRGLADPLLVLTDAVPGLIRAVETSFPRALPQPCPVPRLRNPAAQRGGAPAAGDRDLRPSLLPALCESSLPGGNRTRRPCSAAHKTGQR